MLPILGIQVHRLYVFDEFARISNNLSSVIRYSYNQTVKYDIIVEYRELFLDRCWTHGCVNTMILCVKNWSFSMFSCTKRF